MGITNNAEEFLLRILNFEIVFEFLKIDFLKNPYRSFCAEHKHGTIH
mgnify:CR=1 FL=1